MTNAQTDTPAPLRIAAELVSVAMRMDDLAYAENTSAFDNAISDIKRLAVELRARRAASPALTDTQQRKAKVEKWAQDMAKLCEPEHEAGWGIFYDWLSAFLADVARYGAPSTDTQDRVAELEQELADVRCLVDELRLDFAARARSGAGDAQ